MRYLFLLLFLSGCCTFCPPKIVYVAAECPKPSMVPQEPNYRTEELLDTATSKETIEAFVLDLDNCQSHTEQLENLLNAYGTEYKTYSDKYPKK